MADNPLYEKIMQSLGEMRDSVEIAESSVSQVAKRGDLEFSFGTIVVSYKTKWLGLKNRATLKCVKSHLQGKIEAECTEKPEQPELRFDEEVDDVQYTVFVKEKQ